MHQFAFARADDAAQAIAAHAEDPRLAFIADGTDLIGLMKDRGGAARTSIGHQRLAEHGADRTVVRGWPAHRRVGTDERRGRGCRGAPAVSRHLRGAAAGCIRPTPQHGIAENLALLAVLRRRHLGAEADRPGPTTRRDDLLEPGESAALSHSEALHDAHHGLMLKWSANARSDELRARLDKYTFHHEQVGKYLA
jgi:hypothetical protein